ncbi:uncharacterized protein CEXT_324231 [Caerostris extrusa]|uniref:PWWP domain-containing protein n=1 Tax=Caerostris extrusa TaxID=172846 RepID=A0AAV4Y3D4_CAEEX|nr:uncharacterized protein CEXT_324231 [Caerostris extrusa]
MEDIPNLSSDDDDLPELFPFKPFYPENLKKNDIVWADYKDLSWPALVRNVDKKKKKVSIWFLDSPKNSFKLPFKKIHDFNNIEVSTEIHKRAAASPLKEKHSAHIKKALTFLQRKSEGIEDDPVAFFDPNVEFYFSTFEYMANNSSNSKTQSSNQIDLETDKSKSSDGESSNKNSDDESSNENTDNENSNESSDAESTLETIQSKPNKCGDYLKEERSKLKDLEGEQLKAVVSYIKAGHADQFVLDIVYGKIKTLRSIHFKEDSDPISLGMISPAMVQLPSEQMSEVTQYLVDLYTRKVKMNKEPRLMMYAAFVLLPAVVEKVLSIVEVDLSKSSNTDDVTDTPNTKSSGVEKDCKSIGSENELSTPIEAICANEAKETVSSEFSMISDSVSSACKLNIKPRGSNLCPNRSEIKPLETLNVSDIDDSPCKNCKKSCSSSLCDLENLCGSDKNEGEPSPKKTKWSCKRFAKVTKFPLKRIETESKATAEIVEEIPKVVQERDSLNIEDSMKKRES